MCFLHLTVTPCEKCVLQTCHCRDRERRDTLALTPSYNHLCTFRCQIYSYGSQTYCKADWEMNIWWTIKSLLQGFIRKLIKNNWVMIILGTHTCISIHTHFENLPWISQSSNLCAFLWLPKFLKWIYICYLFPNGCIIRKYSLWTSLNMSSYKQVWVFL